MTDTKTVTTETVSVAAARAAQPRSRFGWASSRFAVIAVWVLLIGIFMVLRPQNMFHAGTWASIFGGQSDLVFLAAGLLCTIIVGEFVDMSVASNFGLASILVVVLTVNNGWNVWLAALTAIVISTLAGLVNGLLVVRLGVNTIVVTLGMGTVLLGCASWASNLQPVSGLPAEFTRIATYTIGGLPTTFYLALILMLGFAYLLQFTPLGRNMRFVGENREVSRLAGVRVNRIRIGAFVSAGVIAGIGGVLSAAYFGGAEAMTSQTYLLPMFAATFLGTAIFQPGRFNPLGTLVAVYFLATGVLGLKFLGASPAISNIFYGGVLVIAVSLSTVLHRRAR
ncbi:ABC transporter permease [Leifsonia sp. Leaf264]|uniref:ABC transporter permease n=1 Tax=Leifsonia sp. Leaf264 TaxID=1736314 RepID=UPI0006FAB1EE|nr:ABC transporter permease [Leifsonia sp. Leaf264]KQP02045.1 ABC transporter permease [Leifsonia sp. Leaf264]